MQEDQINVINSLKLSSSMSSACNQDTETILPHDIDETTNAQITSMKSYKISEEQAQTTQLNKKYQNWIKNQIVEDNSLCK